MLTTITVQLCVTFASVGIAQNGLTPCTSLIVIHACISADDCVASYGKTASFKEVTKIHAVKGIRTFHCREVNKTSRAMQGETSILEAV